MKRIYILLFAMGIVLQTGSLYAHEGHDHDEAAKQAEMAKEKKYVCPMHADVQSDKPGQCPKCGMTLKEMPQEEMSKEDKKEANENHK